MPQDQARPLAAIDHVVVLMLENRSFNNVFGWLYDPQNAPPFDKVPPGQEFDGVSGQTLTNAAADGQPPVPAGSTTDTTNRFPDPGEVSFAKIEFALVFTPPAAGSSRQ